MAEQMPSMLPGASTAVGDDRSAVAAVKAASGERADAITVTGVPADRSRRAM